MHSASTCLFIYSTLDPPTITVQVQVGYRLQICLSRGFRNRLLCPMPQKETARLIKCCCHSTAAHVLPAGRPNGTDRDDLSLEARYGFQYSPARFGKWKGSFVVLEFIPSRGGGRKVTRSNAMDVNIHQRLICSLTVSRPGCCGESVTVKIKTITALELNL